MQDVRKLMLEQIGLLIDNTALLQEYKNLGFKIVWDIRKNKLIIRYCNRKYEISLISYNDLACWHLAPYNNSFLETSIENGINIVFFAIKENEELYVKKGNTKNERKRRCSSK